MSILEMLARHAEFMGYGTVADRQWPGDVFAGTMPDAPDNCIAFLPVDLRYGGSGQWARVQVLVRNVREKACLETAQHLAADLDGYEDFLAMHLSRVSIRLLSGPGSLGMDSRRRVLMSLNLLVRYCEEEA